MNKLKIILTNSCEQGCSTWRDEPGAEGDLVWAVLSSTVHSPSGERPGWADQQAPLTVPDVVRS